MSSGSGSFVSAPRSDSASAGDKSASMERCRLIRFLTASNFSRVTASLKRRGPTKATFRENESTGWVEQKLFCR